MQRLAGNQNDRLLLSVDKLRHAIFRPMWSIAPLLVATLCATDAGAFQKPTRSLLRVVSEALDAPQDESVDQEIIRRLKSERESKLDILRSPLLTHLGRDADDVARFMQLSKAERRRFEVAAKGVVQQGLRKLTDDYNNQVDDWYKDDHDRFLRRALLEAGAHGTRLPFVEELFVELVESRIWRQAKSRVLGDRREAFVEQAQQRLKRWQAAAIAFELEQLDRRLLLTNEQLNAIRAELNRQLGDDRQAHFTIARTRRGLSGRQFWGTQTRLDFTSIVPLLSPPQKAVWSDSNELCHVRFDGTMEDVSGRATPFHTAYSVVTASGLYVDGVYRYGRRDRDEFVPVGMNPLSFTVAIRFRPERLESRRQQNIVTADSSHRWFGLNFQDDGALQVTLNNQKFRHDVPDHKVLFGEWTSVVCSVDIEQRSIHISVNGSPADRAQLPDDFELNWTTTNWLFTNFSNGQAAKGLVSDFLIVGRAMAPEEIAALPITHGFDDDAAIRRNVAKSAVERTLRTRERLWFDFAASLCDFTDKQTDRVKSALAESTNEVLATWQSDKDDLKSLGNEEHRSAIAASLTEEQRRAFQAGLDQRDQAGIDRVSNHLVSVVENKLLLSERQRKAFADRIREYAVANKHVVRPLHVSRVLTNLDRASLPLDKRQIETMASELGLEEE